MLDDYKGYLDELKSQTELTQQQIADLSGIPLGTVGRILSGTGNEPQFITLGKIIKAMGGSVDELLGINHELTHEEHSSEPKENYSRESFHEMYEKMTAVYQHTLDESRRSYHKSYDSLLNTIKVKDRWIYIMFLYCVLMTGLAAIGFLK